jgi:aryl-alcohol dehydrogenase-like predicted oxidoreductase
MKLALGTVQFGVNYGIANTQGQVGLNEARKILAHAKLSDISTVDTAIAYGESEKVLGEVGVSHFDVVTKLPEIPSGLESVEDWVTEQVDRSKNRLGIDSIYGLLLHRSHQLLDSSGDDIYQSLKKLKADGVVKKIGISVYSPDEIELVLKCRDIDLIQAPMSIFDQRLEKSGLLKELQARGIELHARSVFLQGMLLMKKEDMPSKFNSRSEQFKIWLDWLDQHKGVTAAQVCLNYICNIKEVDKVVVGVDSYEQFEELINAFKLPVCEFPQINCSDEILLNPSNWMKL